MNEATRARIAEIVDAAPPLSEQQRETILRALAQSPAHAVVSAPVRLKIAKRA